MGYDHKRGLDRHPVGNYKIVFVLEKIRKPRWKLEP